jgi:RNA polymerase sigma factor (TIGR02999 family)
LADSLYAELRAIAGRVLRDRRCPGLLQTTALVHEAWIKLGGYDPARWATAREEFGALAASVLRTVLVDEARREGRDKRGGSWRRISLDVSPSIPAASQRSADILELDEALAALAKLSERRVRIVEQRFFAGMTVEETAKHLHVSARTVEAEWSLARAWLRRYLEERHPEG